ncbi:transglutaminase domain-containing protein [Thermococcus guaymasensis]|nr:transglutaminase domain-containing protein [Thermococcus guaymasensis]
MRRYLASVLLLLLGPLIVSSALSYSPLPVVDLAKMSSGGVAGGIPREGGGNVGYFLVSPGPPLYLRLKVLDTFESCEWKESPPQWESPSPPQNATLIGNFTVVYYGKSEVILAPLYASNFSVSVVGDPEKGIYKAINPVSSYSFLAWDVRDNNTVSEELNTVPFQTFDVLPYARLVPDSLPPYQKALFIETLLKNNFNLGQGMPKDCDGLADFLYVTRTGDPYDFASAFVLIARAVGLPARVVMGYYVPPSNTGYRIVSFENVTFWPEVYIPEKGWVVFDPIPRTPKVITVKSGEHFSVTEGGIYSGDALKKNVAVEVLSKEILYLPVWNGSLSYLRIVGEDPGIDVLNLPGELRPGERVDVMVLSRGEFVVSADVEYSIMETTLKIKAPSEPGIYSVSVGDPSSRAFVRFPVVVFGNATVRINAYPRKIRPGSNFTVMGSVSFNGKPLDGGIVEAILGKTKGKADYVIGSGSVSGGRYVIRVSVPSSLPSGKYWLVVRYVNFPYFGDSDPIVEVLPPERVEVDVPSMVKAGEFELTGTAPPGSVLQVVLDNGTAFEVNVDERGVFSIPLNLTPGDHVLKLASSSGSSQVVRRITAVDVNLSTAPLEKMGRDYLKIFGTVEGMDTGKVVLKTPAGVYTVPVVDGKFSKEVPIEFPTTGLKEFPIEVAPLPQGLEGFEPGSEEIYTPKFTEKLFLGADKISSRGKTLLKTGDGKFLFVDPSVASKSNSESGSEDSNTGTNQEEMLNKLVAKVQAYTGKGTPLKNGELDLNGTKIKLNNEGIGEIELEMPSLDLNTAGLGESFGSINLPETFNFDVPEIRVSSPGGGISKEFLMVLLVPLALLGVVAVVRVVGNSEIRTGIRSNFVSKIKSLGSPEISVDRHVYIPNEVIPVRLSRESALYVDDKLVGTGKIFKLRLGEGVHVLRAGRREVTIYVLQPKKAIIKLYEDEFLPFASSQGVRVTDSTPKEIMRELIGRGLPENELRTVTRLFEFARYGDVDLSPEDFKGFLEALKNLGVVE